MEKQTEYNNILKEVEERWKRITIDFNESIQLMDKAIKILEDEPDSNIEENKTQLLKLRENFKNLKPIKSLTNGN